MRREEREEDIQPHSGFGGGPGRTPIIPPETFPLYTDIISYAIVDAADRIDAVVRLSVQLPRHHCSHYATNLHCRYRPQLRALEE